MITSAFEEISTLQLRLKAAQNEVASFKSGAKYVQMQNRYEIDIRSLERKLFQRDQIIEDLRRTVVRNRNMWFEQTDIIDREHKRALSKLKKQAEDNLKRAFRAEHELDEAKNKISDQRKELYDVKTKLEEANEIIMKLRAQINRDYETSSIPSSMSRKPKKITNNREKTGRAPGGQPGHEHHGRKKQEATEPDILLRPADEILEDPDFKPTGKFICKQLVSLKVLLCAQNYRAEIFRNSKTGEVYHADFPEGVVDDVNYDGRIKAIAYLLNNECCVSIDKSRKFISDLTGGKLNLSKGMISKLVKTFSKKTEPERKKIFADLLVSPVMNADNTNAVVNGESYYVYVSASPDGKVLYQARPKKGHKGIEGTPIQDYFGIIVHDHDTSFYSYGSDHQECLSHILRYLKDSIINEPELEWNKQMRSLLQEMIHYRNELAEGENPDPLKVADFEERYDKVLQTAEKEYTDNPPSKYYREGYNLSVRMRKYARNHLVFLHDMRVPATNNFAERLLRNFKRKQKQAISFRSAQSIEYLCDGMSVLFMMRQKDENNLFEQVAEIFG